MKKPVLIIGALVISMVIAFFVFKHLRRRGRIAYLVERLGMNATQLESKSDDELEAMIKSIK